jgi:hypothetical protein
MEQVVILGIVILILYLGVRGLATAAANVAGAKFKAYRQVAARFGGKYEHRGLSDPPTVSFRHSGAHVRVGLAPNVPGQPVVPRTRVVARFAKGLPLRLELAPASRPSPIQPPKGTRVVCIGDAEFDRAYIIRANDPDITRDFLSPSVRWAIENLRRLAPPGGMLISVNPERMLVQVDRNMGPQPEPLCGTVSFALGILDQLVLSVQVRLAQGISIVAAGPASSDDAGPPLCKVCGETITAKHVVCTTCRTPHHRDCWVFVGGCSIFGCNSKNCMPV